jgi:hypothetical protein
VKGGVPVEAHATLAADDALKRRARLLLLGKGAVLAHLFDRPRTAEMDETEQSAGRSPLARGVTNAAIADAAGYVCGAPLRSFKRSSGGISIP